MKIGYKKGFIVTITALILLGSLNVYSIFAQTGTPFKVPKPDIKNFEAENSHIVFSSMSFTYDIVNEVVTGCSVYIMSTDSSTYNGDVSVWFGSTMKNSVSFTNVGSTPVLVAIDFDPDIPLAEAISGKVVIQVESP